jgi:mannose-1-phosphate guanylyltransferase
MHPSLRAAAHGCLYGDKMYIVLMAGGIGTRFWPRSRASLPKQMLNIFGERSMLQMTYDRIKELTSTDKILVITSSELKDSVSKQLPEIPEKNIIAEPFGRNTAPCIGLAGAIIQSREKNDEIMIVLPSDHLIKDVEKFKNTLITAAKFVPEGECLITIGIKPEYPETGYGYIQKYSEIASTFNRSIYKVKTFAEKPNLETAKRFLESGDFLWNSGMFIWSVKSIMDEFDEHQPELAEGLNFLKEKVDTPQMDEAVYDVYSKTKSISIDYGIMEAAKNVCVIEADFAWNDVGSWEAVYNISEKDSKGNAVQAPEKILLNAKNNYIFSSKKLVAAVDIEDLVIVETDDALLICRKDESQKVKDVVDNLRRKKFDKYL